MYNILALWAVTSIFMFPMSSLAGEQSVYEIKEIYREMYQYMIAKNIVQLEKLFDDSFILIHMTGMRQSKQEYLKSIQNGTLNYFSEELEHIDIKISENRAVIVGQSRVDASVFGGGCHTWRLQLNIDLIKKNEKWLMTEARASSY